MVQSTANFGAAKNAQASFVHSTQNRPTCKTLEDVPCAVIVTDAEYREQVLARGWAFATAVVIVIVAVVEVVAR